MKLTYIAMLVFVCPLPAIAQEQNSWSLQRDRDAIQVYTRDVAGSPYALIHPGSDKVKI